MTSGWPSVDLRLPDWVRAELTQTERPFDTALDRMRLAIRLSRMSGESGTGGPFGAAVFDSRTHELIAPGVNLVTSTNCSVAHAEVVALTIAQQVLGTYDLGAGGRDLELVSSTEPCAMCFGAVIWSGVRSLVCGARGEDAAAIGFDEGPKISRWVEELERRGIRVERDVLREEARAVLVGYAGGGGEIYNARGGCGADELTLGGADPGDRSGDERG